MSEDNHTAVHIPVHRETYAPEKLPAINLSTMTAADLRSFLKLQLLPENSTERADAAFDLLDRAVEGGLAAIPMPLVGHYIKALNIAFGEINDPNN